MSQDYRKIQNEENYSIPSQHQSNLSKQNDNDILSKDGNYNEENKSIKRKSGPTQDRNNIENILNIDLQQNNNKANYSLGQKNIMNISPNFPKDCLTEQNRFTFEKVEKDLSNRDKVDSYHSATFRKGSEINSHQIGQSSFTNSQNDISNSDGINNSGAGSRAIYKRKSTSKQNKETISLSQFSQLGQPYIKINDQIITAKQFLTAVKDSIKYDYFSTLIGLFKFSELYDIIVNKKNVYNIGEVVKNALFLYENKFKGIKSAKTFDFKPDFDQYYHDISQRFTFQKISRIGRVVERQACICEGKIKQPIIDKNNKNNQYRNSILQPYKEKNIQKVHTRIEQRGGSYNFPQLKWISNPQKKYRILYQDSKKSYLAVYTDTREEDYLYLKSSIQFLQQRNNSQVLMMLLIQNQAVKLRDYSICFSLEDQVKEFTPIGIFRYVSVILPRLKIIQQFRQKMKEYAQYLEIQKGKVITEVSIEESPQQKHVSVTQQSNKNSICGQSQDSKPKFEHIQLEQLKIEEQIVEDLMQDDQNSNQSQKQQFQLSQEDNYQSKMDSRQQKHKSSNESLKQDSQYQSKILSTEQFQSNKQSLDGKLIDLNSKRQSMQNQKDFISIGEQDENDIILEDDEANNIKTTTNQSIPNQNKNTIVCKQNQISNQSLNKNSYNNNSSQLNNNINNFNSYNVQSINNTSHHSRNNININNSNNNNINFNNLNSNNINSNNINNNINYNNFGSGQANSNYINHDETNFNNNNVNSVYSNNKINNSNNNSNNNFVINTSNSNSHSIIKSRNSLQQHQLMGISQEQFNWEQQQSKILTFKSEFLNNPQKKNLINQDIVRDYDQLFLRSFGEQLKMNIRNIADSQITFIKHKVQTMRESGDVPVDIFLTFHQIQFEFKNEKDQQDMIFKPKLRLQISEENEHNKQQIQFMVELQSRIVSKKGKIKEFELFGEKKIAAISNIKLVQMKRNEIKIEIIDEITDSIIARNNLKMEKILSQTEFVNLQLNIEPVQLLSDKLIIQVHLQTFIQKTHQKSNSQDQGNEVNEEDEDQPSNIYDQNLKIVPCDVPHNIEEYLENTITKQNYIIDNFYQSRIFLDRFTPSQFKILLDIISMKGINTTSLQVSLLKQNNKLECYQSIRVCLFKYYMEKQSQHQSLLAKNLSGWNELYDDIVSQNDNVEYANNNQIGNIHLDTSEGYILREAVEDMRRNDEQGADQYLLDMQSQRGSLTSSQVLNQTSRRIVTSIFYKRDLWEQDPSQYIFYDKMIKLAAKGIPNPLRQTLWLELGKANKYSYVIDELIRKYYDDLSVDNLQNKKSYVYKNLLKKSFCSSLDSRNQNIISEMQDDIMWYRDNIMYMEDQIHSNITNIFYSYCHYVELQGAKVIYSKYLIPIAVKALDYFRSVSEDIDNTIEENVFWLVVCFSNNYAKRYYNTIQMMQNAEQTQTTASQISPNINKSIVLSKVLVQSTISSLPANNRSQINANKQSNKLNYIPDDIRLDMLIFEYYLKEKNDKFTQFLSNLSFGVGLYFAERMLCFFADLFNHELLFRLWDYLFIEGSSKNSLKITYFGISIMIYFLNKNANNIMNICKSRQDVLLQLSLASKFEVDCDIFLSETINIYNNLMQKEPNKFPQIQNLQNQQTSSSNSLAQTTKKIFNSIMNVSKIFLNQTLQKHLEVIDQAYNQLDMQKYLNQMMFVQQFIMDKDRNNCKIDLNLLTKTVDELERDINRRQLVPFQSRQSTTSLNQQVKARDRSFQDLSRANTPPLTEHNVNGRVRSTSQISLNTQINKQQFQQKDKIEHLKPVYNFYSKSPIIQKIFIHIHQIQMVEDYNELSIKITVGGYTKNYSVKKVSFTQIIDYFDIANSNQFQGFRSNNFGSNSYQNQSNIYQQQAQSDSNKMIIEVYEKINNISHPLKQTIIDLKVYQPDLLTKDYIYLFDFSDAEDYTMSPYKIHNSNSTYFNQSVVNNSSLVQSRMQTQQTPNVKNDVDFQNNNKVQLKTNYSSGVEFSILVATNHGLGESELYQNMINAQKFQPSRSFTILGNSTNQQGGNQLNSIHNLHDKFNYVPEVMHIHKNQQIESKLKAFNQLKCQNQLEIVQNKSLNTIKNMWKQSSALTQDEFKIFAESTGLKIWQDINLTEVLNHFQYEGRICLFDLIVACILQVEGRFPQKVELLNRIFTLSQPQCSFNQNEHIQGDNQQKYNSERISNPHVYLSMISEVYCKNMLYLPFDQHLNSLKLNNYPHIHKAKYFFDYYSIPSQTNISTPQSMQTVSARSFGPINESTCNFGATQSRISHTIDLTIFIQSFCSQQIQFKGTLDFLIDSQEFINSLRTYFKQQHNIDNPPGKLQIYYWSKGQLRQVQAQYVYSTLGLANLSYVKQQKTKLGKVENINQINNQQNQQNTKIQQVFKLLEFNETMLNLNFDNNYLNEEEVNKTFASLPLLSYFNSLQNSLFSQLNISRQNEQTFIKSRQTVYISVNVDNQPKGYFKLIYNQDSQDMAILNQVNYQNKQFKTILDDWNVIKNVPLQKPSQNFDLKQDNKVIDMKVDHIPLWMKIEDLGRLISYKVMENCINKIEQFSYKQKESFWIHFYNSIKNIDLIENLENIQFLDQQKYYNLDCNLNLQQNMTRRLFLEKRVEDIENVCFILNYKSNYQRPQYLSYFEQPQQYALFHFKDGGKSWLPCRILGCIIESSQSHLFLVEFNDFQKNIFKRTESEISVDQDIRIQKLNLDEVDMMFNEQKNYQIIDDKSMNYNIETQYWDQSQYNGQTHLTNTRMNTSHINLNTSFNNFNDQNRNKQNYNDGSSFFQPTQGDTVYKEEVIQDEQQINKTNENLKTQTDFDSPSKNMQYQKFFK